MRHSVRAAFWFGFYLFLVLLPLVVGAVARQPGGQRAIGLEFAVASAQVNYGARKYLEELEQRAAMASPSIGKTKVSTSDPDSTYLIHMNSPSFEIIATADRLYCPMKTRGKCSSIF